MDRIEFNLQTGELKVIPLTQEEIDAALAAKAKEDAYNSPENVAEREISNAFEADKVRRLQFEIEFGQENRLRSLEGRPQITRAQYRDAILSAYRAI